jgi:hypothetical protein
LLLPPDEQPIQPRLSGTGSLRPELEALLGAARPDTGPTELRALVVEANVTGKRSAMTRKITWKYLRPRYALDPAVPEYRAFFAGMRAAADPAERGLLCLLMFARCDRLLREVTLECVSGLLDREGAAVDPGCVAAAIERRTAATGQRWSPSVRRGVQSHLLSALKDFGLVRGSARRYTVHPRPGAQTALFAARLGRLEGLTDLQVLDARWFRLLNLERPRVVDLLFAAGRSGALRFRMQADVVELDLPRIEGA